MFLCGGGGGEGAGRAGGGEKPSGLATACNAPPSTHPPHAQPRGESLDAVLPVALHVRQVLGDCNGGGKHGDEGCDEAAGRGGGGQGGTEGLSERLAGARGRGHSARRRWQQRHRGKSMAGRRAGLGGGWQAGLALSRDDGVPSEGQPQGRPRSVVDPKVQQEAADLCGAGAGGRGRGTLVEGVLWTQSSAGSRGPARGRRQGAGAGVRTVVEGVWPAGLAANPPLHPPHLPSHPTHLHPTSIPPTAAMMRKAATAERLRRSGGTL